MNEQHLQYLTSIGLSQTLTSRIENFYNFCTIVCPEKIEDLFVDEYITKEGERIFETATFFSKNYLMEANQFATEDKYSIGRINEIMSLVFEAKDFNFKKADEKSRIQIRVIVVPDVQGTFKASKENCDKLWALALNYLLPKMKK